MNDTARQAKILEQFLQTGANAIWPVPVVACPKLRRHVPEVNCLHCENHVEFHLCPVLSSPGHNQPTTDAICARCSAADESPDCLWCRARRAPTPEKRDKLLARRTAEARPGCTFPRAIEVITVLVPSPTIIQQQAGRPIQPVRAAPPPDFFPNVKVNPVTKAVELAPEPEPPPEDPDEE